MRCFNYAHEKCNTAVVQAVYGLTSPSCLPLSTVTFQKSIFQTTTKKNYFLFFRARMSLATTEYTRYISTNSQNFRCRLHHVFIFAMYDYGNVTFFIYAICAGSEKFVPIETGQSGRRCWYRTPRTGWCSPRPRCTWAICNNNNDI